MMNICNHCVLMARQTGMNSCIYKTVNLKYQIRLKNYQEMCPYIQKYVHIKNLDLWTTLL